VSYSGRDHHDGFELWQGIRKLHLVDRGGDDAKT
jgi:hypothetical protein